MRTLNKKQKKLIDCLMNENENLSCWADLQYDTKCVLEKMNDHETIVQNVDRYMYDKSMERAYND